MMPPTTASSTDIASIVQEQRNFFNSGTTKSVDFRLTQLKTLRQLIADATPQILQALNADLHKPEFEGYLTEVGIVQEIDYAIKHLSAWVKPKPVKTPLQLFPGRACIYPEPVGVVLVIGPWNYPFQLMIAPLIGAIAAGNCTILKPSEFAPHTSRLLAELVRNTFDPAYVTVIEGGSETSQALLQEKFDHIFFTGGTAIGKIVMAAAAKHLTPVTLELGGKSPCIVDADIDIEATAKRIAWGKFLNAGQTCIAPDYVLVDRQIKPALVDAIKGYIHEFYGTDPAQSPDYARIISPRHFDRLVQLLECGTMITGGETKPEERYIAPTVLDHVSLDDPVMQDEIFGPILPVLDYGEVQEAIDLIKARPKPLALYLFTHNKSLQEHILQNTSSGSVCINDTIMQVALPTLPFGGVGESGLGSYHGKFGFDTFSHQKSVFYKPFWLEMNWRYAPYRDRLNFLKRIIS